MRGPSARTLSLFALPLAVFFLGLAGCVDDNVVYQDRPIYTDPPPGAGDFVGYALTNSESPSPSCANCHTGPGAKWAETDHANAWATLAGSGNSQEFCKACHTVSQFGNATTDPGGYTGSGDSIRYADVQCESCHGEGLTHIATPEATTPLASMLVGSDLTNGCGECHAGEHHPFVEQWEQSAHGNVTFFAAEREGCRDCHTGNGAMVRWGFNADYTEKADFDAGNGYMDITCGVCHDPHGGPNTAQLRFPVENTSVRSHLCAQCHDRHVQPDGASIREPHAPETALLLGEAGYFFPGMEISPPDTIITTHGNEGNPRLCAGCHVDSWAVTDEATGDFVFNAVGHTFEAVPCVNDDGIPDGTTGCGLNLEERYFASCAGSGCHLNPDGALRALETAAGLNKKLAEVAKELLDQVPAPEFANDDRLSVAEGAWFNYALAYFGRTRDGVKDEPLLGYTGSATHNPYSTRQLLVASIEALQEEYGPFPTSDWYQQFIRENPHFLPRWTDR